MTHDFREPELVELDRLLDAMGSRLAERSRRRMRRRRFLVQGGGVAIAAALALVLLWPPGEEPTPPPTAPSASTAGWEVASDRRFVVFPTSNEDMIVVWLLQEE